MTGIDLPRLLGDLVADRIRRPGHWDRSVPEDDRPGSIRPDPDRYGRCRDNRRTNASEAGSLEPELNNRGV